jgi:hypothetical protein
VAGYDAHGLGVWGLVWLTDWLGMLVSLCGEEDWLVGRLVGGKTGWWEDSAVD